MAATSETMVSVLTPVFNGERHLDEAIRSVTTQEGVDLELLIVDDGSTDGSLSLAREWAGRDHRVRVLQHAGGVNRGVSHSRRLGAESARARYVAFLDADDIFFPEKLRKQVAFLDGNKDCILCHTGVTTIGDAPQRILKGIEHFYAGFSREPKTYTFPTLPDCLDSLKIVNSSTVVRCSQLRSGLVAYPQLFQSEDWLLWLRLGLLGEFGYIPEKLTGYRIHEGSYNSTIGGSKLRKSYSHLEFLITVVALVHNERLRLMATDRINRLLLELSSAYAEGAVEHGDFGVVSEMDPSAADRTLIRRLGKRITEIENSHSYRLGRRAATLFRLFRPKC